MKNIPKYTYLSGLLVALAAITTLVIAVNNPEPADNKEESKPSNSSVLYISLRNRTGEKAPDEYYGERRDKLRTGVCEMEFKPIRSLEKIAKSVPFYIADELVSLTSISEVPGNIFWDDLERNRDENNIILYIHGYKINFEKACQRAARFQREMDLHDRMVLLSWPADGNFVSYSRDEADIAWSVHHIKDVLQKLRARYGADKIDVVAHSLGARGVTNALRQINDHTEDSRVLDELILIAPDIDNDIFQQQLPGLLPQVKRVTLYVSDKDSALKLSHELHGYPRLGEAGDHLSELDEVEIIDVSTLSLRSITGHVYHQYNPGVIADIKRLVDTNESASQRPGLLETRMLDKIYWTVKPTLEKNPAK